jgi:hypothetical protein
MKITDNKIRITKKIVGKYKMHYCFQKTKRYYILYEELYG